MGWQHSLPGFAGRRNASRLGLWRVPDRGYRRVQPGAVQDKQGPAGSGESTGANVEGPQVLIEIHVQVPRQVKIVVTARP